MAEVLTMKIAREYRNRAARLPYNGLQDIGERRALRTELQKRCGLPEIEAVNIINGYYLSDYVILEQRKAEHMARKELEEKR